MKYAVIDIGSNTVRMNIYDVNESSEISRPLLSQSESLGLLNYVTKNQLNENGIDVLNKTLTSFKEYAENLACDNFLVFGTASLRNIYNSAKVVSDVQKATGLKIDIISGENEALLSFEGLKLSLGDIKDGIMVDMGGGSTEYIGFVDGLAVRSASLPFGSLSLYMQYVSKLFPDKEEREKMKFGIDKMLSNLVWLDNYSPILYLVGGTARTLLALRDALLGAGESGNTIDADELDRLYRLIKNPDKDTITTLIRVAPDRLHTVIPGILAIRRIAKCASAQQIVVSFTGIREGYLYNALADR